jgi:hypothetical protein
MFRGTMERDLANNMDQEFEQLLRKCAVLQAESVQREKDDFRPKRQGQEAAAMEGS